MKLLDMWIEEALQAVAVAEMEIPVPAQSPVVVAPVLVNDASIKLAEREFQALLQRKYLWADETKRLGELAAVLGLRVQLQRHHLAGDVEAFALP